MVEGTISGKTLLNNFWNNRQMVNDIALLFLQPVLSRFRWYRKKKGGRWYKMYDFEAGGGFEGSPHFWAQDPNRYEGEVVGKEVHPYKNGLVINLRCDN
jgi:hypothetical protein